MSDTRTARLRQVREFLAELVLGPQPWDAVGAPIPDLFATPTVLAGMGTRATYIALVDGRTHG